MPSSLPSGSVCSAQLARHSTAPDARRRSPSPLARSARDGASCSAGGPGRLEGWLVVAGSGRAEQSRAAQQHGSASASANSQSRAPAPAHAEAPAARRPESRPPPPAHAEAAAARPPTEGASKGQPEERRPSSPGPRSAAPPATTTTAAPPGREKGRRSGRTGAGANALWPFCRRPIAVVRAEVTSDDGGGGGSGDHDQPHFSRSCRAPRLSSSEHQPGPCAPSQPPGAAP